MKRIYTNYLKIQHRLILLLFFVILLSCNALSQQGITEGKDFWFGIPHNNGVTGEGLRWGTQPVEIWISSRVTTKAVIEDASGTLGKATYVINANQTKVVPISDYLENTVSENVTHNGIHVSSVDPISVTVMFTYTWSGESFMVIPAEWLGKQYYTLNMYEDKAKLRDNTTYDLPCQVLIVGTQDNTRVTYNMKVDTKGGTKKGAQGSVTLSTGDTYLIEAALTPALNQDNSTDFTGSYISATKPIAVISGHTKGAFPRYAATYNGFGISNTDFIRNMLIEMMPPMELIGNEYISVPLSHPTRTYSSSFIDQQGDIVRFVATHNGTIVSQMRADGSGMKQISITMNAGDWFDVNGSDFTTVGYFQSNYPVLAGQYAKSFLSSTNLGFATAGMGFEMTLVPVGQWCTYSNFNQPSKVDNFINITFKTTDANNLFLDGVTFSSKFGSSMMSIAGTPYSYVSQISSSGTHTISSINGAKFGAYAYGNSDGAHSAYGYGYPIAYNYGKNCMDSIGVLDSNSCGTVQGTVYTIDLESDTTCSALYTIIEHAPDTTNFVFTPQSDFKPGLTSATYKLQVADLSKFATDTILFMSITGNTASRIYNYFPEEVKTDISYVDYGIMKINSDSCINLAVTNLETTSINIIDMNFYNSKPEFTMTVNLPLTLLPNQTVYIPICGKGLVLSSDTIIDSIYIAFKCYTKKLLDLQLRTGEPILDISDQNWADIEVGKSVPESVNIKNTGIMDAVIDSIYWNDKVHFVNITGLNLPLTLMSGQQKDFSVTYKPNIGGVTDTTTAFFKTNCTKDKLYSFWQGNSKPIIPDVNEPVNFDSYELFQNNPNPVSDMTKITYRLTKPTYVIINFYNTIGEKIETIVNTFQDAGDYTINLDIGKLNLPDGIYFYTMQAGSDFMNIKKLIYIK